MISMGVNKFKDLSNPIFECDIRVKGYDGVHLIAALSSHQVNEFVFKTHLEAP